MVGLDVATTETKVIGREPDLWGALQRISPELAVGAATGVHPGRFYDEYPGFRQWMLVEFALMTPTRLMRDKLEEIREEQAEDGGLIWPPMSKRKLDTAKNDLRDEWRPITARIEEGIEQVGVLSKNRRLLALQQTFEELHDRLWDERDKSNKLYLLPEMRAILRQIAEEKGELGERGETAVDALGEIAKMLAAKVQVQGSGMRDKPDAIATEDYYIQPDGTYGPEQRDA